MSALPSWMYGDPLEVTIRKQDQARAKEKRRLQRIALNRARIRALVADTMRKASKA